MSASTLLRVKSMLLNVGRKEARDMVKRALRLPDAASVAESISASLKQPEVAKLIRPARASQSSSVLKLNV